LGSAASIDSSEPGKDCPSSSGPCIPSISFGSLCGAHPNRHMRPSLCRTVHRKGSSEGSDGECEHSNQRPHREVSDRDGNENRCTVATRRSRVEGGHRRDGWKHHRRHHHHPEQKAASPRPMVPPMALIRCAWKISPNQATAATRTAALVAIVYPLLEGRQLGWPAWTWLLLAGGIVLLGGPRIGRGAPAANQDRPSLAHAAVRDPGLHRRARSPTGLIGRAAGLLPGLRALAAGGAALQPAPRRAHHGRPQRR
jgi:hypothetical protein